MNRALELAEFLEGLARHDMVTPLSRAIADSFEIEDLSPDLIKILVTKMEAFEALVADIKSSDVSDRAKGLYLGACANLAPFVMPHRIASYGQKQLAEQKDQIDLLFLAADVLPNDAKISVPQMTVTQLLKEIDAVSSKVSESSFEDGFAQLVLSSLETLKLVIRNYERLGPDGAAKIYGSAAAQLGRLLQDPAAKGEGKKKIIRQTLEVCKKVGGAIIFAGAVVGGANELISGSVDLLGLDEPEATQANPAAPSLETPSDTAIDDVGPTIA